MLTWETEQQPSRPTRYKIEDTVLSISNIPSHQLETVSFERSYRHEFSRSEGRKAPKSGSRVVRIVTNCAKRRRSQDRFWKRREAKTNPAAGQIQANRGWSRCGVDLVFVVAHGLKIGPASQFPRLTGHRFNQAGSRYLENWLFAPRYSGAVSSSPPLPPPLSWDETRKTPRRRILSRNSHTFFIFLSTFSNKNNRCRSSFRG